MTGLSLMRLLLTLLLSLLVLTPLYAQTPLPTAQDDAFTVSFNDTLTVETGALLLNDSHASGDSLVAILLQGTTNGTLTLRRDGSFIYTPSPGFSGTDTFTYAARTTNFLPEVFTVDSTQSTIAFTVSLSTLFGDGTETDASPVRGSLTTNVTPNDTPFAEAHVTTLHFELIEGLSLSYNWGLFNAAGLDMSTDPGGMRLSFVEAGPASPVIDDVFIQDNNAMRFEGAVAIAGTGLLSALIPPSTATLDTTFATSFGGTLSQSGTTLSLASPFAFANTLDLGGQPVDLDVTGDIVATADAYPVFDSEAATVTINVINTTATEETPIATRAFRLAPNYPNPFVGTTTLAYALDTPAHVRLSVVDVLGRIVATVVDQAQAPGSYHAPFDASDLPSGLYFYRLEANDVLVDARTMTVLR